MEGGAYCEQPGWGFLPSRNSDDIIWRTHSQDSSLICLANQCWPLSAGSTGLGAGALVLSTGVSPQPAWAPSELGSKRRGQKCMVIWCSDLRSHIAPLHDLSQSQKVSPRLKGKGQGPHHSIGGMSSYTVKGACRWEMLFSAPWENTDCHSRICELTVGKGGCCFNCPISLRAIYQVLALLIPGEAPGSEIPPFSPLVL